MSTITIKAELSAEDRALFKAVIDAAAKITGASAKAGTATGGKAANTGTKGGKAAAKEEPADDGEGDADAGEGDGEDGDGDEFEGAEDGDVEDGEGEETAAPTRADVHAALKKYATAVGAQAKAIELMKKHGGTEKLSALKELKFAAVIAAAEKGAKAKK